VTRPSKKEASQEYDITEILAERERSSARFFTGWMTAADAQGAWKGSQLPPFSLT